MQFNRNQNTSLNFSGPKMQFSHNFRQYTKKLPPQIHGEKICPPVNVLFQAVLKVLLFFAVVPDCQKCFNYFFPQFVPDDLKRQTYFFSRLCFVTSISVLKNK